MQKRCEFSNTKTVRRKLWEQVPLEREVERLGSCVSKNSKSLFEVRPLLMSWMVREKEERILRYVYDNESDMKKSFLVYNYYYTKCDNN